MGPLLFLVSYSVVFAIPMAIVAWGIAARVGRFASGPALHVGVAVWAAAILPPAIGLVADASRTSGSCQPGEECYRYLLWWLAIPVGWVLAAVVLVAGVFVSRLRLKDSGGDPRSP